MTHPVRDWSDVELRRMRSALEDGVPVREVARRFRTSDGKVVELARSHAWRIPHALRSAPKPGRTKKAMTLVIREARQAKRNVDLATLDERMAAAGCRYLVKEGRPIDTKAARLVRRLEARDRAERTLLVTASSL